MSWVLIELNRAANLLRAVLLTSVVGIGVTPAAAATCASLAGLALPDTTITAAEPIAAGIYTAPDGEVFTNLPAFCRVYRHFDIDLGFGHQDRGLDALLRLERKVSGYRQR